MDKMALVWVLGLLLFLLLLPLFLLVTTGICLRLRRKRAARLAAHEHRKGQPH